MLNFEKRTSIVAVGPHIDTYEIEREVREAFEEEFGEGEVVEVYASRHPYEIGVTLFLKHYDRQRAWRLGAQIEERFADRGLPVGILVMPESELVHTEQSQSTPTRSGGARVQGSRGAEEQGS